LAAPWAPRGDLSVSTDPAGKVTGRLKFAPGVELAIGGTITPAAGKLPEGIDLIGEGLSAVYKIRGFFIDGIAAAASQTVIVGSVVAMRNDLAKQPDGTTGPFVMFPAGG